MTAKQELFDIFVGAETGLLKGAKVSESSWQNLTSVEKVSKQRELTALCWADEAQTRACIGRRDCSIEVYDTAECDIVASYESVTENGVLKGLVTSDSSFISCTDKGLLRVLTHDNEEKLTLDVGENIFCLRQNPAERHQVATGGKENELKIWDLNSPDEPVFMAKNVPHDWLNLRVPVWVTDAGFTDGGKIVTCTGQHQVRMYDPLSPRRRPVLDIEVEEYPLTCMGLYRSNQQVVVGNTQGMMALVDLRGKGHVVQKYKGFAGGIRGIYCHEGEDVVVSCGLDRFLRLHDINNGKLLNKFYMKSRLNCLLVADKWHDHSSVSTGHITRSGVIKSEPVESDGEDDEMLWSSMGIVKTKPTGQPKTVKKKKRKQKKCSDDDDSSDIEDRMEVIEELGSVGGEDVTQEESDSEEEEKIVKKKRKERKIPKQKGKIKRLKTKK